MKMESGSEVAQLCPTLSDPMDCSLPGSSIQGIFRVTVLEWGAIAFSLYEKVHIYKSFHLHGIFEKTNFSDGEWITLCQMLG